MTSTELSNYVGQHALVPEGDYDVLCKIVDVRTSFGRVDFLVEPLAGAGRKWVAMDRTQAAIDAGRKLK